LVSQETLTWLSQETLTKTPITHRKLAFYAGALTKMLDNSSSGNRRVLTATLLLTLLISTLTTTLFIDNVTANWIGYYPWSPPPAPIVKVTALNTEKLTLTFLVQKEPWITPSGLHGVIYDPNHDWGDYSISTILVWIDGKVWRSYFGASPISMSLEGLSNGWHTLEVTATASGHFGGMDYGSRDSSGVIEFQVDTPPPSLSISAVKNTALKEGEVQFAIQVIGSTLSWVGYSLDGKENVTVNQEVLLQNSLISHDKVWKGKLTLAGLSSGVHSLVVYTEDQAGNTGASATKEFTVEKSVVAEETQAAPLPVAGVAAAMAVSPVAVGACFIFYFKKRKR
jgi:hypothetical protein